MSDYAVEWKEILDALLVGDLQPEDERVCAFFQSNPPAQAEWEEYVGTSALLDAAALQAGDILAEAAAAASTAEGAPGEEHAQRAALDLAKRALDESPRATLAQGPRPVWRSWLLAAAAVLVAVGLSLNYWKAGDAELEDIMLGGDEEFALEQPLGEVASYDLFRWKDGGLPDGCSYRLRIYDASVPGEEPLHDLKRLTVNEWIPQEVERAALPPRIWIQVHVVNAFGELEPDSVSANAWLSSE